LASSRAAAATKAAWESFSTHDHDREFTQPQLLGREHAPVAGDEAASLVDLLTAMRP
jgi:hypothetical protein